MKKLTNTIIRILVLSIVFSSCNQASKDTCKTPEAVSYTNQIATVVETDCFLCHAPEVYKKKASRIKIYDYSSLKKMGESGQLIGSITHAKGYIAMPYKKDVKIDSCTIELFKKWVEGGMIE